MTARLCLLALGLGALTSVPAEAFAPTDGVWIGVEPQRTYRYEAQNQVELLRSKSWRSFVETDGTGWMARFDEQTGTPHRMWGTGIDLGPIRSADEVTAALRGLIDAHPELFGASTRQLRVRSAEYVPRMDTWYVDFDVTFEGIAVWSGGITARIKHNRLILMGADTYPNVPRQGALVLTGPEAISISIAQGPAADSVHTDDSAELVWLPREVDGRLVLQRAWKTRTDTSSPPGQWVSFIDAEHGELLNVHNEVRFIDGSVTAEHDIRNPASGTTISSLPYARITNSGGGAVYADADGLFSLPDQGGPYSTALRGTYLRVTNQDGPSGSLNVADGAPFWTSGDATWAEIDTYVFLHHVKAWGEIYGPDVSFVYDNLTSNVNYDDSCNAWYDGNVNFLRQSNDCNNTARLADVNYHEWGHGFHQYSLVAGTYDGSISEGASDVIAFLLTGDSVTAPYFFRDGSGIRDANNNRTYPDDVVGETHADGMIFSGAMWDLWGILNAEHGPEQGHAITSSILAGLLKGGPTLETSFDEAVVADDDDGDLSNGTPHYCALIEAFTGHGLGPAGLQGTLLASHEPLSLAVAEQDLDITVDLVNYAAQCGDATATDGTVVYRVDGGAWASASLSASADSLEGVIPAQDFGAFVEYYIEFDSTQGNNFEVPLGGYRNPFSFYAGDVLPVYCDDFEADDGGYTHELLSELASGDDGEGADDWMWGTPAGLGGDPLTAYSGDNVWGNDLALEENFNGEYQNNRHNRLMSPVIPTEHYRGVFLQYQRWLTVEDGFYDNSEIRADDEVVWTNYSSSTPQGASQHHRERQWVSHSVDLGEAGDDGSVQLSWHILSDEGLTFGGWTLDDVCIYAPASTDNRLGITDFQATDGESGGVTLTWTHPRHAPVEKVVVVRSDDVYPSGPTDGTVVFEDDAPQTEREMSVLDIEVGEQTTHFYAVYAFDGDDWLSWTEEGWNADTGFAVDVDKGVLAACGCASAVAPIPWVLALLPIAFWRRRRVAP